MNYYQLKYSKYQSKINNLLGGMQLESLKTDGIKTLYHGTTIDNANSILELGYFDSNKKKDEGWGQTYGQGVYLTPNLQTAITYAGTEGIVIQLDIEVRPHYLSRDFSPNNNKHRKQINRLIAELQANTDRNCLLNKNGDEFLYFGKDIQDGSKIKLYRYQI